MRAGIKLAWWGNANLNLPVKTPMNDARALLAMKFNNIEDVDDENEWAEVLTSQVSSTCKHWDATLLQWIRALYSFCSNQFLFSFFTVHLN